MSSLAYEKCGLTRHSRDECQVIKFIQWYQAQHNSYYLSLGYSVSFSQLCLPFNDYQPHFLDHLHATNNEESCNYIDPSNEFKEPNLNACSTSFNNNNPSNQIQDVLAILRFGKTYTIDKSKENKIDEQINEQHNKELEVEKEDNRENSLSLYTSPSPRDKRQSRMPSSA
jgi:hypothetical protein